MSTSLPMLLPSQATASGESSALPVNTAVGDSSQAFANVLGSHFQADGITADAVVMPLVSLEASALMPLLSVSSVDGQNLPLDLSQTELPDGNGLPLSPELMWSGMLIVNDTNAAGPQLYQLSEDGQTLTPQVDPNIQAQITRAMNRFAPLSNADMPGLLNVADTLQLQKSPGLNEQSLFFTATATTPVVDSLASQRFSQILPAALLNNATDDLTVMPSSDQGVDSQTLQILGLSSAVEKGADRFPEMMHLQMSASPKSPAWAQGIGERVQWLVQQNIQGAEIRLNPPELGAMEVKVQFNGDQATQIHFSSPNGSVREALEAAIPRLREMFADAGLSLGDVNVSHQSLAEQQKNGDSEGGTNGRGNQGIAAGDAGSVDEKSATGRWVSDGLVDMYV